MASVAEVYSSLATYAALGVFTTTSPACVKIRPAVGLVPLSIRQDTFDPTHVEQSTSVRPIVQDRKTVPSFLRKLEKVAATSAALLGVMYSTSPNVAVGVGGSGSFDETLLYGPTPPPADQSLATREQ